MVFAYGTVSAGCLHDKSGTGDIPHTQRSHLPVQTEQYNAMIVCHLWHSDSFRGAPRCVHERDKTFVVPQFKNKSGYFDL